MIAESPMKPSIPSATSANLGLPCSISAVKPWMRVLSGGTSRSGSMRVW